MEMRVEMEEEEEEEESVDREVRGESGRLFGGNKKRGFSVRRDELE